MIRVMDNLVKSFRAGSFEDAMELNEDANLELNEKELYYATRLKEQGFEVRFTELHILHRRTGGNTVISFLRSNLKPQ